MVSGTAPTVSVCIRAHSRPLALQQAIESALAQTFTDFELVISDDSGQMAEVAYASGDSRIRYHQNPTPVGSTTNIRAACSRARGRLIALLETSLEAVKLEQTLRERAGQNGKVSPRNGDGH